MARNFLPFSLLWSFAWSATLFAQATTAAISGVVRDDTGAVLPGVTLTIKNLDTGITRTVMTDEQGRHRSPNLALGNYEVQAELSGFQTGVRSGIQLTVGREAIVDFTLKVGQIEEKVVVTGEAPLVDVATSTLSGLVDEKRIRDLPLNGRSFEQLALLQPGVQHYTGSSGGMSRGAGRKMSIGGARHWSNSYLLDGTDIQNFFNTTPGSQAGQLLGVEAIREFGVLTNTYSAEYGRAAGGVVNVVTKSGTNGFHGSAFEFHRNDALDARNFFDEGPDPPEFKRNQFGFSLGGPIARNRSFFFGTYEALRERLGITGIANVPDELARQGALPGVQPFLELFPLPNGRNFGDGRAEFIRSFTRSTRDDYFQVRVDHKLSDKDSFFVRYTFDDALVQEPETLNLKQEETESRHQYVTIEYTRLISPTLLHVARFGFNRSKDLSEEFAVDRRLDERVRFGPSPVSFGSLSVSGLAAIGRSTTVPRRFFYSVPQVGDQLTYTKGRHSLKAGVDVKRFQFNEISGGHRSLGGRVSFRSLELFLRGRPRSFEVELPQGLRDSYWRQTYFGSYVQDDVRATPHLSLNLGLRYEFITTPKEKFERMSNVFDTLHDTAFTVGRLFAKNLSLRSFAPRVGFAWDPTGSGKTSVRAGFGIFYDQLVPFFYTFFARNAPFFPTRLVVSDPPFPQPFQPERLRAVEQALRIQNYSATPYLMQYNLNLQREIAPETVLTVGYSGSRGVHMIRTTNANTAIPQIVGGRKFWPRGATRRNPAWGDIRLATTDTNSFYNAFLLGLNRRFSRGFQIQGSYTLSKNISEGDELGSAGIRGTALVMDFDDRKTDRSLSALDVRHNFALNYSFDLPFGDLSGALGKLVGGWSLNGITTLSTGQPFQVFVDFNRSRNLSVEELLERPDLVPGRSNNPIRPQNPDQYFDPSAFELAPEGFFGNLGRNTVISPGAVNFDLSLVKSTAVTEQAQLQFRAEFFNLFNRANFDSPGATDIFDRSGRIKGAGRITETTLTSRQIQFGLKILF